MVVSATACLAGLPANASTFGIDLGRSSTGEVEVEHRAAIGRKLMKPEQTPRVRIGCAPASARDRFVRRGGLGSLGHGRLRLAFARLLTLRALLPFAFLAGPSRPIASSLPEAPAAPASGWCSCA